MFELFIALFGSIYAGGKVLTESDAKREVDRRFEDYETRLAIWRAQVIDRALEEDLRDYISTAENKESVWLEIRDVYDSMHYNKSYSSASEWAYDGVLDKTKVGRDAYTRHRFGEPLDIMLAKRGKLRSDMDLPFIPIVRIRSGEGQRTRAEWDRIVEFWLYIKGELCKNGIDAKLMFHYGYYNCESTGGICIDTDNVELFRYQPGTLRWQV